MEPEIPGLEEEHGKDPFGQRVGLMAAILAMLLAVVTISSHRAHTSAVIERTSANDQWSFYQSKKLKGHTLELGKDLLGAMANPKTELIAKYDEEIKRYAEEAKEIQKSATEKEAETKVEEARALRFDLGEGFLELGLVLASLYFISKKKLFPAMSIVFGVIGAVIAALGFMQH